MATRTSRDLETATRARAALEMRIRRFSYAEIAAQCGYSSRGAAFTAIKREIQKIPREAAKELRTLELESLDRAESALRERIEQGEPRAIDVLLKIIATRGRLLGEGADSPEDAADQLRVALAGFLADAKAVDHGSH